MERTKEFLSMRVIYRSGSLSHILKVSKGMIYLLTV